jgi:hypothetical protein
VMQNVLSPKNCSRKIPSPQKEAELRACFEGMVNATLRAYLMMNVMPGTQLCDPVG